MKIFEKISLAESSHAKGRHPETKVCMRHGRRPIDGSIRDWKANKRAVKGVICAKRGKNLQLFIPTDISKAEMLRTPSRQNDTRSIKN